MPDPRCKVAKSEKYPFWKYFIRFYCFLGRNTTFCTTAISILTTLPIFLHDDITHIASTQYTVHITHSHQPLTINITHYPSAPITHYPLPITHYPLTITHQHPLPFVLIAEQFWIQAKCYNFCNVDKKISCNLCPHKARLQGIQKGISVDNPTILFSLPRYPLL